MANKDGDFKDNKDKRDKRYPISSTPIIKSSSCSLLSEPGPSSCSKSGCKTESGYFSVVLEQSNDHSIISYEYEPRLSINSSRKRLKEDMVDVSFKPYKCDILFSSSNKKLPTIILTFCDDESDTPNQVCTTKNLLDEPSCSSAYLSPIPAKDLYKSFLLTPQPYHPVPDHINLISGLGQSFPHIISKIFSYLEPHDLCKLRGVSRTCRNLVMNDPTGWKKREDHLFKMQTLRNEVGQENWPIKKTTPEVKSEIRGAFGDVKNTQGLQANIKTDNSILNAEESLLLARTNVNSSNIEATPIDRRKRRRIEISGSLQSAISSSSSKSNNDEKNSNITEEKDITEHKCDPNEEPVTSSTKAKPKTRKNEPIVGSKASKRHLRRL